MYNILLTISNFKNFPYQSYTQLKLPIPAVVRFAPGQRHNGYHETLTSCRISTIIFNSNLNGENFNQYFVFYPWSPDYGRGDIAGIPSH